MNAQQQPIQSPSAVNLTADERRLLKVWKATSDRFSKAREEKRELQPAEGSREFGNEHD
jgi:hypothetical protein